MAINVGNGVMLYTPQDAANTLGIPLSLVNCWARSGFIEPSVVGSRGRGKQRYYSFRDLVELKVAFQLRQYVSLQALRRVVEHLRQRDGVDSPLTQVRLVVHNNDVYEDTDEDRMISMLRSPGQSAMKQLIVVELDELVQELKHELGVSAAA